MLPLSLPRKLCIAGVSGANMVDFECLPRSVIHDFLVVRWNQPIRESCFLQGTAVIVMHAS